jgi:tryptophan-rich sensory protein
MYKRGMASYDLTTYDTLKRSKLNPPSWVFGPVWAVLYALIAMSGWLYFRGKPTQAGLLLFGGQLALNLAWPYIFFQQEQYCTASVVIFAMIALVVMTIYEFSKRNRLSGLLLVPYLAWISFASYLNLYVCLKN